MSELNTLPLLSGDSNKSEYNSSDQVAKDEGEAYINE